MLSLFITTGLKSSDVPLCIDRECHLRWKVTISLPCICFSACYYEETKIKQYSNSSAVLACVQYSCKNYWMGKHQSKYAMVVGCHRLCRIGPICILYTQFFHANIKSKIFVVNKKLPLFFRTYSSNIEMCLGLESC